MREQLGPIRTKFRKQGIGKAVAARWWTTGPRGSRRGSERLNPETLAQWRVASKRIHELL